VTHEQAGALQKVVEGFEAFFPNGNGSGRSELCSRQDESATSAEGFHKLSRLDLECTSEGHDVQQCDVALATLNTSDVVAVYVGQFGQLLLGEALSETELAQVNSERNSGVRARHPAMIVFMTTMSLHTMSVI
jgi:hypothetical protein